MHSSKIFLVMLDHALLVIRFVLRNEFYRGKSVLGRVLATDIFASVRF